MKKFLLLMGVCLLGSVAACNTVKGIGEDIEAGGRIITDTAEDVQDEVSKD
jgi:entericidin B